MRTKHVAIIGANKEALKLLPILLADKDTEIRIMADPNPNAMLFKLGELGYRLSPRLNIKTTHNLDDIKSDPYVNTIIDAIQNRDTTEFLKSAHFLNMEKFGPLSARLLWEVRGSFEKVEGVDNRDAIFSSLREIVDSLYLITDRKELTSVLLKLVIEFTGAQRASIMLLNEAENSLRVEAANGMDEEVVRKIRVPLGTGVSGYVAQKGKAVIISGRADPTRFMKPMERDDAKSAMCVPLVVDRRVFGVVNVSSSESPDLYTDDDLDFLSRFAALAAEVIHKSIEYETIRSDAAKFSFWKEIDGMMSSGTPLEKNLPALARKIAHEVPGMTCLLYLYNDKTRSLVLKASSAGGTGGLGIFAGIRKGQGIEGYAMETGRDVFLVDRTEEDMVKKYYISLPMVCNNRFVGTLSAQVVSPGGLSPYHEAFLKDIRTLVAQSICRSLEAEQETRWGRKVTSIDDIGLDLITVRDPARLTRLIAQKAADAIAADGALLRIDQGEKRFQTVATYGLDDTVLRRELHYIEKETVLEVLRRHEPVSREFSADASPLIKCVFSVPIFLDGEIIGVLTLFHKVYEGTQYEGAFSDEDADTLQRFILFAARALDVSIFRLRDSSAEGREEREEPSPMEALEMRVEQELNRARRKDERFVLATMRIVAPQGVSENKLKAICAKFLDIIRDETRNFDYVTMLEDDVFALLYPLSDNAVKRVIDVIVEAIRDNPLLNKSFLEEHLTAYYGSAQFPADGDSFTALFSKASRRDIINIESALEEKVK